ncbi:MAG TPA: hypothetical protein VMK66_13280 [Myxococcales bacterium]|nr:hypothetical protein [Myxococcales bacterium]
MRKSLVLLSASLLCLAPGASRAVNVPLPIKDAKMNVTVTVQTQALINENGSPDGSSPSYDIYARRTRLQVSGEIANTWAYYFQVDNGNFGKYGNFTSRMIVQDAFATWAPTGLTGGSVLMVEGGLMFYPASRLILTPISNQLMVEGHPDMLRGFTSAVYPANRSTGVQVRGWLLNKKVGYRGGIYEGVQPFASAGPPPVNPLRNPALALFTNWDLIGSEEGGYLYNAVRWQKDPVLSFSVAGSYQSNALRVTKGLTDQKSLTGTVYLNYPLSEQQELIALVGAFLYGNGTGSRDTGTGFSGDLSFRAGWIRPYIGYEWYTSADCPTDGSATPAQCAGANGVHTGDSRNTRMGLDFYINKNQNHVMLEFALNRGQSTWGPQAITAANAGYVPYIPAGQQSAQSLGRTAQKSLLLHWSAYF